jgi:hypothetical protein
VGSARWAVQKAIEAGGGEVTFDTTADLSNGTVAGGVHFGDPIVDLNTIKLLYGNIQIIDYDASPNHFSDIEIHGPSYFDSTKAQVEILRTGSSEPDTGPQDDVSVFDISMTKHPNISGTPNIFVADKYHPDYDNTITFDGLVIAGGKEQAGAGISATGFLHLNVMDCQVTGNDCFTDDETKVTNGGGIGAFSQGIDLYYPRSTTGGQTDAGPQILTDSISYGPIVTIDHSQIFNNQTMTDHDESSDPPIDTGGGIYLQNGATLLLSSSQVIGNTAENGAGGIDFGGGMFYENPAMHLVGSTIVPIPGAKAPLYTTYLKINTCEIDGNVTTSKANPGDGGALVIRDSTGGMVADATFFDNQAVTNGGAVVLTGIGTYSPFADHYSPYTYFVGTVAFVADTFEYNSAGKPDNGDTKGTSGSGGAFEIEGFTNAWTIANCTLSGNTANYGTGGAMSISTQSFWYSFGNVYGNAFDVSYNGRDIGLKTGLDRSVPVAYAELTDGQTYTELENCTITKNKSIGKIITDDSGMSFLIGARGGGIAVQPNSNGGLDGTIIVGSTIVAQNSIFGGSQTLPGHGIDLYAVDDGSVSITLSKPSGYTSGFNLAGVNGDAGLLINCQGDMYGKANAPLDAQLLRLMNYGGPVDTHALRLDSVTDHSPAVDRGINPLGFDFDARGTPFHRDVSILPGPIGLADVGAYELQKQSIVVSLHTWADSTDPDPNGPPVVSFMDGHSRINRIVLSFSQSVQIIANAPSDAFSLTQMAPTGSGTVTVTPDAAIATSVTSITLRFSGDLTESNDTYHSLKDGWYHLTAYADKIVSMTGVPIDGNGDGTPGDDYQTPTNTTDAHALYRLFGDSGNDHGVYADDFGIFRLYFSTNDADGSIGIGFDFNGDGTVSSNPDFLQFRMRFGGSI